MIDLSSWEKPNHKAASGNPPKPKPKVPMEWVEAVRAFDGVPAGYWTAFMPNGVEVAQAKARYFDGEEHELKSEIYELVREADMKPTPSLLGAPVSIRDALSHEAREERIVAATLARERMKPNQRSPLDMEKIARELQNDGQYKERAWQMQQERRAQRKAASDQAVTFLLQLDPEFLSDEQCAQLGKVLAHISERGKS